MTCVAFLSCIKKNEDDDERGSRYVPRENCDIARLVTTLTSERETDCCAFPLLGKLQYRRAEKTFHTRIRESAGEYVCVCVFGERPARVKARFVGVFRHPRNAAFCIIACDSWAEVLFWSRNDVG